MLEFVIGYLLGGGSGYYTGYEAGQVSMAFHQCQSQHSFNGGDDVYRCRLEVGHTGGHVGRRTS